MKRIAMVMSVAVLAYASSCLADTEDLVKEAIESAVQGQCSEVMSTMLKATCESQMPKAAGMYKQLGKLNALNFKGKEATPSGQADVYQAVHEHGQMLWMAIKAPDGKLSMLWSPGPSQ